MRFIYFDWPLWRRVLLKRKESESEFSEEPAEKQISKTPTPVHGTQWNVRERHRRQISQLQRILIKIFDTFPAELRYVLPISVFLVDVTSCSKNDDQNCKNCYRNMEIYWHPMCKLWAVVVSVWRVIKMWPVFSRSQYLKGYWRIVFKFSDWLKMGTFGSLFW